MQSDRLLHGLHKVCSHDLPNQLVALQSLLQMLQHEEADRLSTDGQEYLRRLQNVAQRTNAIARFLKEMEKLHRYVSKPEEISLSLLGREIQAALKQQFPHNEFLFDWQWSIPAIVADYRTFIAALAEVLICAVGPQTQPCRLRASSQERGNQVAVHFVMETTAALTDNGPHFSARGAVVPLDQRLEIILAREWLAVSASSLELTVQGATTRFCILVPTR
jgi:light-regulated signal transduction histidine kinase (bacteriophytochrome)